jgi:hypothetical protein
MPIFVELNGAGVPVILSFASLTSLINTMLKSFP